jgi:alkylated DNA repair protein alkB family protein 1
MTDLTQDKPLPAVAAMKVALGRYRRRGANDAADHTPYGLLCANDWEQVVDPSRANDYPHVWKKGTLGETTKDPPSDPPLRRNNDDNNDDCYYQGALYELCAKPGVYVAPRALGTLLQRALAYASLTCYCEAPHATNMEGVPPKPHQVVNAPHETMWVLWKQEHEREQKQQQQQQEQQQRSGKESRKRPSSSQSQSSHYYRSFRKLSWATVGYHYDWTRRLYHEDAYSDVPSALQTIGATFARTVGQAVAAVPTTQAKARIGSTNQNNQNQQRPPKNFAVSAGIINYYTCKSVMGGHRDDLEYDESAPIVSLSLGGRPCLFLVGSVDEQDDSTPVVPILLRPGDVLILSGTHRMAYHAMARLLPVDVDNDDESIVSAAGLSPSLADLDVVPAKDEAALDAYLRDHRININLRQVYPDGQDPRGSATK